VESAGDMVAVSTGSYGEDLLKDGSLASDSGFRAAVPDADRAGGVLYVDFDSKWRDLVVESLAKDDSAKAADEFDANTKPLRGLGVSSWRDGDVSHGLLKITTD